MQVAVCRDCNYAICPMLWPAFCYIGVVKKSKTEIYKQMKAEKNYYNTSVLTNFDAHHDFLTQWSFLQNTK